MEAKQFAEIVMSQIRAGEVVGARGGQHAMMCWGFNKPQYGLQDESPFLLFKVTGRKHTGYVRIGILCDEYHISLAKTRGKDRDFYEAASGVHCEELAQVLDTLIET